MNGEVPLPGMPEDPPAGTSPPAGVHVRRYRPHARMLCGDCIEAIHKLGPAVAPLPSVVRWQMTIGALTLHLCEWHKEFRLKEMAAPNHPFRAP